MALVDSTEVVVIGGGPVGLASVIQLGRAGVRAVLLERRATFSRHPKAGAIHPRTMEIFRQWGVADRVRESGGGDGSMSFSWVTRLTGIELGTLTMCSDPKERELFYNWSPELVCLCGQDVYEPILADLARTYSSIEIRLGCQMQSITQDSERVFVEYKDNEGRTARIEARYAIGSDGVRSLTKEALGIQEDALPSLSHSINVLFEAPLDPYRAGRTYGIFWIVNGDTRGALFWKRRGDLWSYNFDVRAGEDPQSYTADRCAELIRAAVGAEGLPVKIHSMLHWQRDQAVTKQWRKGRVFLAGDAAHRFPPSGGFGMNSGVQDSQNLSWKLIARLRWGAGDALLDSYEAERLPVARFNSEQTVIASRRLGEMWAPLRDAQALADIEKPSGELLRNKIAASIPKQRDELYSQGQQFGRIYQSTAVMDDGTQARESTVSEYHPTGHPGARATHFWLNGNDGRRLSSIDLYDGGFKVFTGIHGSCWIEACREIPRVLSVSISGVQIGTAGFQPAAGQEDWTSVFEIEDSGAVLIRPDGHIAARWKRGSAQASALLIAALRQVLSIDDARAD